MQVHIKAMEMEEKGITGAWKDFSRDPTFATRAMIDVAGAKVFRSFNPEYTRYERDLEELKKTHPDVHNLAMGTAVLFALAFSAFCGVAYLMAALMFP
mgnify:CR=1 FL=1